MKMMNIKDFRDDGFLQEVNRQFFHPLGLAMVINIDDNGEYSINGICDKRDDPEGIFFSDLSTDEKIERYNKVDRLFKEKIETRLKMLGFVVQPIGSKI